MDGILEQLVTARDGAYCEKDGTRAASRIYREVFGLDYHRRYLEHDDSSQDLVYIPQVGDDVVFFSARYRDVWLYYEGISTISNFTMSGFWSNYAVKCRVIDVEAIFPDACAWGSSALVMTEITLAVLAVSKPGKVRKRKRSNGIAYFDASNPAFGQFTSVNKQLKALRDPVAPSQRQCIKVVCLPDCTEDYVVLDSTFESGVRAGWQIGDRIQAPIIEGDYFDEPFARETKFGVIEGIYPQTMSNLKMEVLPSVSAVRCINVKWDCNGEDPWLFSTMLSPWDLRFADEVRQYRLMEQGEKHSATQRQNARRIKDSGKQELLMALDRIMTQRCFQYFVNLVEATPSNDYVRIVANPIDLTKIRARVANGYYRLLEAVVGDVRNLCRNTKLYERATSGSFANADRLVVAVQEVIGIVSAREGIAEIVPESTSDRYVYHPNEVTKVSAGNAPAPLQPAPTPPTVVHSSQPVNLRDEKLVIPRDTNHGGTVDRKPSIADTK